MKELLICLWVLSFMLSFQTPIWAQNSEKLFQQGMMKEEGEGNLKEAISIYNSIVNNVSADRKLRAKALLQVGSSGDLTDWLTATTYAVKDMVVESSKLYICVEAHTSGTFSTDLTAVKWILLGQAGDAYTVGGTDVAIGDGGTGQSTAGAAFTALKQAASATATGVVELATQAEVNTGTDAARSITPVTLDALVNGKTDTVITASDEILFADVTDSNKSKKDTVQGILDLVPAAAGMTTGDVKASFKTAADSGFVLMDDGNIGNAASSGTTRANADTAALFTLLWDNIADVYAAVSGGRGANAAADYAADKTIDLPKQLGRMLLGYGTGAGLTARALGENGGAEDAIVVTHDHAAGTLAAASGGAHTHVQTATTTGVGGIHSASDGKSSTVNNMPESTASAGAHTHTISGSAASSGSSGTDKNMTPWAAINFMIKL